MKALKINTFLFNWNSESDYTLFDFNTVKSCKELMSSLFLFNWNSENFVKKCFKFLDNFLRMSFPSAIKRTQASDKDNNQEGGAISSPIGGSIDEIRKEFGLVSERVQMSKEENITFSRSAHGVNTE